MIEDLEVQESPLNDYGLLSEDDAAKALHARVQRLKGNKAELKSIPMPPFQEKAAEFLRKATEQKTLTSSAQRVFCLQVAKFILDDGNEIVPLELADLTNERNTAEQRLLQQFAGEVDVLVTQISETRHRARTYPLEEAGISIDALLEALVVLLTLDASHRSMIDRAEMLVALGLSNPPLGGAEEVRKLQELLTSIASFRRTNARFRASFILWNFREARVDGCFKHMTEFMANVNLDDSPFTTQRFVDVTRWANKQFDMQHELIRQFKRSPFHEAREAAVDSSLHKHRLEVTNIAKAARFLMARFSNRVTYYGVLSLRQMHNTPGYAQIELDVAAKNQEGLDKVCGIAFCSNQRNG